MDGVVLDQFLTDPDFELGLHLLHRQLLADRLAYLAQRLYAGLLMFLDLDDMKAVTGLDDL